MTPAVYGALIDQAHQRGLRVASHLYYLADAHGLLDAGVDVIAHSVRDQDVDAALIDEIKRRNVGYTPTLTRDLARFGLRAVLGGSLATMMTATIAGVLTSLA